MVIDSSDELEVAQIIAQLNEVQNAMTIRIAIPAFYTGSIWCVRFYICDFQMLIAVLFDGDAEN